MMLKPLHSWCLLLSVFLVVGCADSAVVDSDSAEPPIDEIPTETKVKKDHYYVVVTDDNFEEVVLNSDKPVLIDFWAAWCGPCRMIAPTIEELAEEFDGRAIIAKVDVDTAPGLAEKFEVTGIPFLSFHKGGEQVDAIEGIPGGDLDGFRSIVEEKLTALIPDVAEPQK